MTTDATEPRIWDAYLSEEDKKVFPASGWGAFLGIGERPALIVIDVTYAFTGDRDEPLLDSIAKWRNSCGPTAWRAMPHIRRLVDGFHDAKLPVFYSKGSPVRPDGLGKPPWRSARSSDPPPPVPGFDGFDIVRDIEPEERDVVVVKDAPSAFFDTRLRTYLSTLQIDSIVLCGTTTSGCVRATALDGFSIGLRVAVAEEATFDRGEASHAMSLFDLNAKYADVMSTADVLTRIGELPAGLFPHLA